MVQGPETLLALASAMTGAQAGAPAPPGVGAVPPAAPPAAPPSTRNSARGTNSAELDKLIAGFFAEALGTKVDDQATDESKTMKYSTLSRKVTGWQKALRRVDEVKDFAWCRALVLVGLHDTSFAELQAQDRGLKWDGWQCRALLLELLRMFDNCLGLGEVAKELVDYGAARSVEDIKKAVGGTFKSDFAQKCGNLLRRERGRRHLPTFDEAVKAVENFSPEFSIQHELLLVGKVGPQLGRRCSASSAPSGASARYAATSPAVSGWVRSLNWSTKGRPSFHPHRICTPVSPPSSMPPVENAAGSFFRKSATPSRNVLVCAAATADGMTAGGRGCHAIAWTSSSRKALVTASTFAGRRERPRTQ